MTAYFFIFLNKYGYLLAYLGILLGFVAVCTPAILPHLIQSYKKIDPNNPRHASEQLLEKIALQKRITLVFIGLLILTLIPLVLPFLLTVLLGKIITLSSLLGLPPDTLKISGPVSFVLVFLSASTLLGIGANSQLIAANKKILPQLFVAEGLTDSKTGNAASKDPLYTSTVNKLVESTIPKPRRRRSPFDFDHQKQERTQLGSCVLIISGLSLPAGLILLAMTDLTDKLQIPFFVVWSSWEWIFLPIIHRKYFLKNKILPQMPPVENPADMPPLSVRAAQKAPQNSPEITPLLLAVVSGKPEQVRQVLQERPADINVAYSGNGNTPLHVATANGQEEIVRILLAQPGANKFYVNNDGKTALDLAKEKNFSRIIDLLS